MTEEIKELYCTKLLSMAEIGNLLGISRVEVSRHLQSMGVPSRSKSDALFIRWQRPKMNVVFAKPSRDY